MGAGLPNWNEMNACEFGVGNKKTDQPNHPSQQRGVSVFGDCEVGLINSGWLYSAGLLVAGKRNIGKFLEFVDVISAQCGEHLLLPG